MAIASSEKFAGSDKFIGRGTELGRLLAALERAEQGQPGLVLVAGDAGVGKSRLLTELAAQARQRGAQVLLGGCLEVGGVGLPYVPIITDAPPPITSSTGAPSGRPSSSYHNRTPLVSTYPAAITPFLSVRSGYDGLPQLTIASDQSTRPPDEAVSPQTSLLRPAQPHPNPPRIPARWIQAKQPI
jgi:predicted ATPase